MHLLFCNTLKICQQWTNWEFLQQRQQCKKTVTLIFHFIAPANTLNMPFISKLDWIKHQQNKTRWKQTLGILCSIQYILLWQKRLQFICNVDQTYDCVEIGSGFSFSLPLFPAPTYRLSQIPLGNIPSYTSYWWYNITADVCAENAGDQVQLPFFPVELSEYYPRH